MPELGWVSATARPLIVFTTVPPTGISARVASTGSGALVLDFVVLLVLLVVLVFVVLLVLLVVLVEEVFVGALVVPAFVVELVAALADGFEVGEADGVGEAEVPAGDGSTEVGSTDVGSADGAFAEAASTRAASTDVGSAVQALSRPPPRTAAITVRRRGVAEGATITPQY